MPWLAARPPLIRQPAWLRAPQRCSPPSAGPCPGKAGTPLHRAARSRPAAPPTWGRGQGAKAAAGGVGWVRGSRGMRHGRVWLARTEQGKQGASPRPATAQHAPAARRRCPTGGCTGRGPLQRVVTANPQQCEDRPHPAEQHATPHPAATPPPPCNHHDAFRGQPQLRRCIRIARRRGLPRPCSSGWSMWAGACERRRAGTVPPPLAGLRCLPPARTPPNWPAGRINLV